MKSDIKIPTVENVFLAAIPEWSDDFMETIWNVYLINIPNGFHKIIAPFWYGS